MANTHPDTVPLFPGELRTYGMSSSVPTKTTDTYNASGQFCFSNQPAFVQFLASTSSDLYSIQPSDQNYQYEEIKGAPVISIPYGQEAGTTVSVGGGGTTNQLFDRQPTIREYGYTNWPCTTFVAGNNNFTIGEIASTNAGDNTKTVLGSVNTFSNLVCSTSSPPPSTTPFFKYIDRVEGLNCTQFLAHDQNLGVVGKPAIPISLSLPGFAAGGALMNPLDTDLNGNNRDHNGSIIINPAAVDSSIDLPGFQNKVNGANVWDTNWLPDSVGLGAGFDQPVIYSIPRQPLGSIGQLKNMYCHYSALPGYRYANQVDLILGFSLYTIGGSYQAGLPTNIAFATDNGFGPNGADNSGINCTSALLDDNFLSNEVLFDGYFFSTVPPQNLGADSGNWPITNAASFSQASIQENQSLPNARLIYYNRAQPGGNPSGTNSPNIADLQPSNVTTANIRKPAANLLINGAFNINSTSIPAWIALLSSSSAGSSSSPISNTLKLFLSNTTSTTITNQSFGTKEVPFLNFPHAFGPGAWGGVNNNTAFFSLVDISLAGSPNSIQTLASNIVSQIEMRGPFLSLGDFINHRLTAGSSALSNSGALQAAIDNTTINSAVVGQTLTTSSNTMGANTANPKFSQVQLTLSATTPATYTSNILPPAPNPLPTTSMNSALGIPGTLMQNDLLQAIAPAISDRSDTFKIRFYGQALSPIGSSEAEAYGEAVVQRFPEYEYSIESGTLDGAKKANYAYDDPNPSVANTSGINGLTANNYAFGRRFRIISFRWLNKNEL